MEWLPALKQAAAVWLEEPFAVAAYEAYGALARKSGKVKLAGGEGAHDTHMAHHLIDYGGIGFVQIDCGRIGEIGPASGSSRDECGHLPGNEYLLNPIGFLPYWNTTEGLAMSAEYLVLMRLVQLTLGSLIGLVCIYFGYRLFAQDSK